MPIKWKRAWVSDETYESAGVFDVNGDGTLEIVLASYDGLVYVLGAK